ncbi:MAG: hypothetical protein JNK07_09210 [Alphaproteobacteria bacterium]|nr:hypothetical protein [Alphaproteobacteria bacterium]
MQLPVKEHELKQFLGSLPSDKALTLAAAVERGRLAGDSKLPADLILEGLRPQLRRMNARRIATPQRLVCEAFADFLVNERDFKQPGRIARASVRTLWRWLAKEGLRVTLADFESQIARAVLTREAKRQADITTMLQNEIASVLRAVLERAGDGSAERRALVQKFGGEDTLADIEEMTLLLSGAVELNPLRGLLPKRIDMLTEQHTSFVRDMYDQLSPRRPELCPYVGLLVLARLKRPWEALRLAAVMSRRTNEILFSQTDMGVVGDILLADMEHLALDIASVRPDMFDPDLVLNKLERFVQMSGGLVREIGVRRDGKWGQRLIKIRQLASDAMDALIARAPREILAALPVQRLGAFGGRGPRRPDLSREPDFAKIERALQWGRLLAGATPYAGGGAFVASHKDAFDEVSQYLRSYAENMVSELRALDFDKRPRAEAYMQQAERLSDTILGVEETDLMRRRVAAALAR